MRILLIEDEQKLVKSLKKTLELEGYDVDVAYDGERGLDLAQSDLFDLILLDLMLPQKSGVDVCKDLRKKQILTPIIMLTALDLDNDKIDGLDSGADDYMVKPFNFEELLARIRSLYRRSNGSYNDVRLVIADLELDSGTHEVKRGEKNIYLTPKEYCLLECLMRANGNVMSREKLFNHIWGDQKEETSNQLDVLVRYLRRKIESPGKKKLIYTVRGFGYKIKG